MRAILRRVLAMLDGTPPSNRGQSLVELTLTLPILLLLLMGLTEIGWYANNYLTLLDVVREAGRAGAQRDPMEWVDGEELNYHRLDCESDIGFFNKQLYEGQTDPVGPGEDYGYFIGQERPLGYYDYVACTVIPNMSPLEFNNEKDDIAVSVFSYIVNNRTTNPEVRIVGRFPARANECEGDDEFDPFDWNHDGSGGGIYEDHARWDAGFDNIRGYVFRGNHATDYPGASMACLGSEFSTAEVEQLLNFPEDDNDERLKKLEQAPNFGLVLVEIFWTHRQLLGLPWFNLGPINDGQTIYVWTFFPVSAAEPDIDT